MTEMPMLTFYRQNLASGGTYDPLTGWQYERLPQSPTGAWLVEMAYINSAISSANVTVTSGSDTLVEDSPVGGGGTDGVFPAFDQPMLTDIAAAGDKLKIHFRETAASGTGDVMGWIRVTPV